MGRTAYLDCFSGISGDMMLGAIVDAGVALTDLSRPMQSLRLPHWELSRADRRDPRVGGTKIHVVLEEGHDHEHRHLSHILGLVRAATDLPPVVREQVAAVFHRLAEAEAEVHATSKEEVHFHEVGAVDAIVDVCGSVLGLHLLDVADLHCSPLALGSGTVRCAHGRIPVPVPATTLLLRGFPVRPAAGDHPTGELVTPTGAALVTTLASTFGPPPAMVLDAVAYGLGDRDRGEVPNALRLLLGRVEPDQSGEVDVLTTLVDDADPRTLGVLPERLLAAGALDAILRPVQGKKGRPALEIVVLSPADPTIRRVLEGVLFAETPTLGLRWHREQRTILAREFQTVSTDYGPITVKVGRLDGQVLTRQPEFEMCLAAAKRHNAPVRRVIEAAQRATGAEGTE